MANETVNTHNVNLTLHQPQEGQHTVEITNRDGRVTRFVADGQQLLAFKALVAVVKKGDLFNKPDPANGKK